MVGYLVILGIIPSKANEAKYEGINSNWHAKDRNKPFKVEFPFDLSPTQDFQKEN